MPKHNFINIISIFLLCLSLVLSGKLFIAPTLLMAQTEPQAEQNTKITSEFENSFEASINEPIDLSTLAETQSDSVCAGQSSLSAPELEKALAIMEKIIIHKGLSPKDEEKLVIREGLTVERLNCLLAKFMAAEDIFSWGTPSAYGVHLTPLELKAAAQFSAQAPALKKYLEETLNIKAE